MRVIALWNCWCSLCGNWCIGRNYCLMFTWSIFFCAGSYFWSKNLTVNHKTEKWQLTFRSRCCSGLCGRRLSCNLFGWFGLLIPFWQFISHCSLLFFKLFGDFQRKIILSVLFKFHYKEWDGNYHNNYWCDKWNLKFGHQSKFCWTNFPVFFYASRILISKFIADQKNAFIKFGGLILHQ